MAQKRRKHGKIEARQTRARVRFKPGVLLLIVIVTFILCFAAYMVSATRQKDYWETVIVPSMEQADAGSASGRSGKHASVTNPVPSSERADDSRMGEVAFIGDVAAFATYYKTNSGMVFTDAVTGMAESRMRSIARSLHNSNPKAIYLWYQAPADLEAAGADLEDLVDTIMEQNPSTPVYILTATPGTETSANQHTDTWNATLFAMADKLGLHYIDVSTTLKANDGTLSAAYAEDEKTFYTTIGDQILTHIAD